MRILVKILPHINLNTRLSGNSNKRRYTSWVQVISEKYESQNLSKKNLDIRRSFGTNETNWRSSGHNWCRVLLIPSNLHDVNEHYIRSAIRSIFLKPRSLQKIQESSENVDTNSKKTHTKISNNEVTTSKDQKLNLQDLESSIVKQQADNVDHWNLLTNILNKNLKQIFDNNGLQYYAEYFSNARDFMLTINVKPESFILSTFMKIDASKLKLQGIGWHKNTAFSEMKGFLTTNFPLTLTKKCFSTSAMACRQKAVVELKTRSKCDPNYNFPYLSKIFGTDNLLMRSDAYSQALIEAAKRRAAIEESMPANKMYKNFQIRRPQVMNIKGCSVSKQSEQYPLESDLKSANTCPPVSKTIKDNSSKSSEYPHSSKVELQIPKEKKEEVNNLTSWCEDYKQLPKNSHKMTYNQESSGNESCFSESPTAAKQIKDNYNKNHNTSYKLPEYSKPNKLEIDKMYFKAKKSDHKDDGNKSKSDSSEKAKAPSQKNLTFDEDKEYKPKCNEDPCKQNKTSDDGSKISPLKNTDSGKNKETSSELQQKEDPYKTHIKKEGDHRKRYKIKKTLCKRKKSGIKRKYNPCKKVNQNGDPPKKKNPSIDSKPQEISLKKETQKDDPCKKKKSSGVSRPKEEPSSKEKPKEDPYKKKNPCADSKQREDLFKKEKRKEDPCKKREPSDGNKQKEDPCKKVKPIEDPSMRKNPCVGGKTKKEEGKEDPCKKKEPSGGNEQKEDPCKKVNPEETPAQKKSPCVDSKPKEDPCGSKKKDPCQDKPFSPCGSRPLKTQKENPCKTKKTSPCVSSPKKEKGSPSSRERKTDIKTKGLESSSGGSSKKQDCGKPKRETKPNCGKQKKYFSTLANIPNQSCSNMIKRTLTTMPSLRYKNFYNFGFMRHLSSKRDDKNKKSLDDLARRSQCKSVGTRVPLQRKPAFNPHPKDGLRQCYPTYDMDCKKLCKDARKTDCKKHAYLKDTDMNNRKNKK